MIDFKEYNVNNNKTIKTKEKETCGSVVDKGQLVQTTQLCIIFL